MILLTILTAPFAALALPWPSRRVPKGWDYGSMPLDERGEDWS